MEARVAAAVTGVLGAVLGVEDELALIGRARPREGFPHADLVAALPDASAVRERAVAFCSEVRELPPDYAMTALTATSKQLSSLHIASQALRSAVEWSSRFTAIDWWVARRVNELGAANKKVLVAPGLLREFSIERTSAFRSALIDLGEDGRLLSGDDGKLREEFRPNQEALADFHILKVPPSDGISPIWHPPVLGHELAHLKYTDTSIRAWTSGIQPTTALVEVVVQEAGEYSGKTGVQLMTRSLWLNQLERWLVEVACDSVAAWLYGPAGLAALSTILAAYAVPVASSSHPHPALRLAIQEASNTSDLDRYRPSGDPFASVETQATAALVELALSLRDHVREELAERLGDMRLADEIAESTESSLANHLRPSSSDWPEGDVAARATAIESGLVRGLWRRQRSIADSLPESEPEMNRDVEFISQAIDALEFAARFDAQRKELGIPAKERMPLPNVLWLSESGVRTTENGEGASSHDLRLGRHFIVFQRSLIADINSLSPEVDVAAVQREVEIGWGDRFILHPSELVLAVTFESLRLETTCSAQVLSRSSLGRLGLLSATAVQVQPGYHGFLTLELVNLANVPLRVTPGQRVAQVVPIPALGESSGYVGGYQGSGARPRYSLATPDWEAPVLRTMNEKSL